MSVKSTVLVVATVAGPTTATLQSGDAGNDSAPRGSTSTGTNKPAI